MLQIIGTIISFVIGFFIWKLTLILSRSTYPFGPTGSMEIFVFFAPIVCFILPVAIRSFIQKLPAHGIFLLAIAPIAGFLNFLPLFIVAAILIPILGKSEANLYYSAILCQIVWVSVLWMNLKKIYERLQLESHSLSSRKP